MENQIFSNFCEKCEMPKQAKLINVSYICEDCLNNKNKIPDAVINTDPVENNNPIYDITNEDHEGKIKILNLYAGIGGNRKLWPDDKIFVVAVELMPEIAKIYQDFFPNDKVIIADAHQYLLDHYTEFDFIWSSPPCPTHSVINVWKTGYIEPRYPDMALYQEIIFLKHFFKGKFVVENVIAYYDPLIKPQESGNHYFWTNFLLTNKKRIDRGITDHDIEKKEIERGFKLPENLNQDFKKKVLNNCVFPDLGMHIFNCAFNEKQEVLS